MNNATPPLAWRTVKWMIEQTLNCCNLARQTFDEAMDQPWADFDGDLRRSSPRWGVMSRAQDAGRRRQGHATVVQMCRRHKVRPRTDAAIHD